MSSSPTPSSANPGPRHALTAVEKQRVQLEKLLKDPAKPAYVPPPPKDKTLRPAREMMKNVQGSSAGAGSGEFHVYKASRRREYERLKLMEEEAQKEAIDAEFERKRKEAEAVADVKTAKNRAKRQKKKDRAKHAKSEDASKNDDVPASRDSDVSGLPMKKRRLINGKELVFRKPGDESESDDNMAETNEPSVEKELPVPSSSTAPFPIAEESKITILEDD